MARTKVEKFDALKFQAEQLVKEEYVKTPEGRRMVKDVKSMIKEQQAKVRRVVSKGKPCRKSKK